MDPARESEFPSIAVAVLNHNGQHHLMACLSSLEKQSYPNFEVFLIDNGSTDSSLEWVTNNFPSVKIIAFNENLGFCEAYNSVVNKLSNEYIVFLNNDTQVSNGWLNELVKPMLQEETVGACGSKIFFLEDQQKIAHAGGKLTLIGSGMDVNLFRHDTETKNSSKQLVGFVCGASMLVRRSAFLNVGGFDNDYFAYHDDVDLCWRMWLHGYKVVFVPTSKIYHKSGGSWGERSSSKRVFLGEKNRLINITKNFGLRFLAMSFTVSFVYDMYQIVAFLKQRNFNAVNAIVKAQSQFFRSMNKTLMKRRRIQNSRNISDDHLVIKFGLIANLRESINEVKRINQLIS